jgi:DNA polymerase
VASCTKCDNVKLKDKNGEVVELKHNISRTHINLWSHWQGSLNAEILLIGQDWGRINGEEDARYWANKSPYLIIDKKCKEYSATNNNLRILFEKTLNIDISRRNDKLFFTNSVQCYKTGSLSNKTSDRWYGMCNEEHVKKLVEIIKPKIIIPIGIKALNGLRRCGEFCNLNDEIIGENYFRQRFVEIVEKGFLKLQIKNDKLISDVLVCPVFHCGIMSCNLNRSLDQQINDWGKIKDYFQKN